MGLCAPSLFREPIVERSGLAAESYRPRKPIPATHLAWILRHQVVAPVRRFLRFPTLWALRCHPQISGMRFSREGASLDCRIVIRSTLVTPIKDLPRSM